MVPDSGWASASCSWTEIKFVPVWGSIINAHFILNMGETNFASGQSQQRESSGKYRAVIRATNILLQHPLMWITHTHTHYTFKWVCDPNCETDLNAMCWGETTLFKFEQNEQIFLKSKNKIKKIEQKKSTSKKHNSLQVTG